MATRAIEFCERMGLALYASIQNWHEAETLIYSELDAFNAGAAEWGVAWPVMCGIYVTRRLVAETNFDYWGWQVDAYASAIRGSGCLGPGY